MSKPDTNKHAWLDEYPLVEDVPKQAKTPAGEYQSGGKGDAKVAQNKVPERSLKDAIAQGAGNVLAGAVRGAGSIGATILAPIDMAKDALDGKGVSLESNRKRRTEMDSALETMGAEPESWAYRGGKFAGELAGTAGAGGVMANGVRAVGATRAMSGLEPITKGIAAGLETGGFRVGELAGTGLGTATRVATGAATGGVSAAMVNPEDAGAGALIGGAIPAAVRTAVKTFNKGAKAVRSVVGDVSPEVRQLANRAEELGIKIPADRLVDSKALNATAASLEYVPMSGRAGTIDLMNTQLNRALSRTFGQDSPNVTGALRKAGDELGGKFDTVLQANTVKITPAFKEALAEAENQATNELGTEGASIIHKQIASILTKGAGGEIDGQAAYNIKKTLDRIGQRNTPEAFYARDLKKSLMDALNDSLGAEQAQSFRILRQQYGNMLALQNMARNGVEGEISVARLANLKHINNPDLQELADIAAQFVKPREGMHGAAQRVAVPASLTVGGAGAAGVVGGAAVGLSALGGAAAVMGAGRLANKALNSQTARNAVLKPAVQAGAQTTGMSALTKGAARAAPLLGASTMASAQPAIESDTSWLEDYPLVDGAPAAGAAPQSPAMQPEAPPQQPFQSQARPDGTLAINGDAEALRQLMQQAGVPARSIMSTKTGVVVGRSQVERVQRALQAIEEQPQSEQLAPEPHSAITPETGSDVIASTDTGTTAIEQTATQPLAAAANNSPQENEPLAQTDTAQAATETIANVQDPTQATGAEAQATPVETPTAMASNAAPTQELPGTGSPADLQSAGLTGEGNLQNDVPPLAGEQFADAGAQDSLQPAQAQPMASIDQMAHAAATSPLNDRPEPTLAQQRAGNYAMGHDRIAGMDVSIENPQGSVRRGVDPDGQPWETRLTSHYGYFRKTSATDGDKLDVFIKPGTPKDYAGPVFVIDQVDPRTGKLDEHKTILGAKDEAEAKEIYAANYAPDWKGMGSITRLPLPVFKAWAQSGSKKEPLGDLAAAREEVEQADRNAEQLADMKLEKLRSAGEDVVAGLMQKRRNEKVDEAPLANEIELLQRAEPIARYAAMPEFQAAYRSQRSAGRKPAESVAFASVLASVDVVAPKIGMPQKAIEAMNAHLQNIPLEAAPGFIDRFTKGLIKRGVMQDFEGSEQIGQRLQETMDTAMNGAVDALYGG